MRDKLEHDYLGVDVQTVWLTAKEDVPELQAQIRTILSDFGISV
jgi:uncharacterized protein with HEPN domain